MNFEEQISAFMDGALTQQEETEFLHILSVSPEKRALLHSYQGVRASLVSDARTSSVPSQLDAAILGAAGVIGAAGGVAGGAAAGGALSAAGTIGAGGTTGMGAAAAGMGAAGGAALWTTGRIITAILLGLSLFTGGYFLNDALSPVSDAPAPAAQQKPPYSSAITTTPSVPSDVSDPSAAAQTTPRIVYRNVYVTRVDTVYIPRRDASPAMAAKDEPRVVARYDTVFVALMQRVPDQRPINIIEQRYSPAPVSLPGRFEVELQREHLTTYPYIDYGRIGADRVQQQFAASVGYVFDDHHAAGITAGEKSFAMEYYRVENDSLFLYQRQPALFYGAGFYRYSQPLLPGVTPELTLQLGGCDYGPVFGARLAVRFDPLERISLLIGANGTLLAYQYKDKLFTSHSLGLSYGIRYRF
jgi:hypothetical protein